MFKTLSKRTTVALSTLALVLLGVSSAQAAGQFYEDYMRPNKSGHYRIKITNTTAYKLKAKWYCFDYFDSGSQAGLIDLDSRSLIDADTYPGSAGRTRETSINDRCESGLWAVGFQAKISGSWREMKPNGGYCGDGNWTCGYGYEYHSIDTWTYAPNGTFNSDKKLCIRTWAGSGGVRFEKVGC